MTSLSVVVPAYNERDNLGPTLAELVAMLRARGAPFEIVVVDDGSRDGSEAVLAAQPPEVRVVRHPVNRGLTAALKTGFLAAAHELVTWAPADGQIPATEVRKILDAWRGHDLVLSTYAHRPDGVVRAVMSRGLRVLVWAATGFRDRLEGTYLFRRALLDEMELVSRTSAGSIGFEIGAKVRARGLAVTSVEIACAPRRSGRSKVANARNIAAYLGELWRIGESVRRETRSRR